MSTPAFYWGTGRRKTAVARVRLIPGEGSMVVNGRTPRSTSAGSCPTPSCSCRSGSPGPRAASTAAPASSRTAAAAIRAPVRRCGGGLVGGGLA